MPNPSTERRNNEIRHQVLRHLSLAGDAPRSVEWMAQEMRFCDKVGRIVPFKPKPHGRTMKAVLTGMFADGLIQ